MTDTSPPRPEPITWNPATLLDCTTEEGREGKEAYLEHREPDFSRFKRSP